MQLQATTVAAQEPIRGAVVGQVAIEGDLLSVRLDSGWVQYLGAGRGDRTPLEAVTMRLVVVADSAGQPIPQGVSGALPVADALQVGERRALARETLGVPLPPGVRVRELWLAVQFRGTLRPDGADPTLLVAFACSDANVMGRSSRATVRARRMRAGDVTACRM